MKTTIEGSPYSPPDPVVPRVLPSPISEDKIRPPEITEIPFVVSEPKPLTRSNSSTFDDMAQQLENPADMIDFHPLLSQFCDNCIEISNNNSISSSDSKILPKMISSLLKVIEAIPTEDLLYLINGFQSLTTVMHSKPSTPSLARLKSPKPITIIPVVKGQEKKGPKLITPRLMQAKPVNTHQPLAPLTDLGHSQDLDSLLNLINFVIVKASYHFTESLPPIDKKTYESIANFCFSTISHQNHISTRIYSAAVLSNLSKDKESLTCIYTMPNWTQTVTNCLSSEIEQNDSFKQFIIYLISFINNVSADKTSENLIPQSNISIMLFKILKQLSNDAQVVLRCFCFLSKSCNDASSRSDAITEFGSEDLIGIFLSVIDNFRDDEAIISRSCFILSEFVDKEFDFSNAVSTANLSVIFDSLKTAKNTGCVESLTALIACLISVKSCIPLISKNLVSLLQTSKPFLSVTSCPIILETLRTLCRATTVDSATVLRPLDDWLSTGDTEIEKLALCLCFDVSEYGIPLDVAQIVLPYVGDDRKDLSFLAIRVISGAAKDPMISSLSEKIDSRVKRVIENEELDQGTVSELGKLFESLPQGVLSEQTLDDARAFDDLAIYTI